MSSTDSTQRQALIRIAASTSEAVAQMLERIAGGEVTRGKVTVVAEDASPFATVLPGSAAAGVAYVDGATGGNVFIAPPETVRMLAARMGVEEQAPGDGEDGISELALSAVAEAANQMMSAAASALGVVLGQEIEISPPTTKVIDTPDDAEAQYGTAPYATTASFSVAGAACRLVQLIPSAFVLRVSRALDELEDASEGISDALADVKLRVWAELGRTALPLGDTLQLPLGSVVELDRAVEAPVDLFVNGLRFAHGRLMVRDERWAFELDELIAEPTVPSLSVPTP
jgi:flagellar motor switch protein FliN